MTPWAMSFDVGCGDFFNAECFWSPETKSALEIVYHSFPHSPSSAVMIYAMESCPSFRHVQHKGLMYPTEKKAGAVPCMRDHAVSHRMMYYGSSFLTEPLDCEIPSELPEDFIYITHSTPKNGEFCPRWITDPEWLPIIARLESLDTVGLVVNMPGGRSTIPVHPMLIDFTGKTTLPQAIEILKRARGYIGIDSNAAILAAQLFEPADLWVRTQNPYLYETPCFTYPPQTDFSFLCPRFDRPGYPTNRPEMKPGVLVELRCNALVGSRNFGAGVRVEVDPDRANRMISAGQAGRVSHL